MATYAIGDIQGCFTALQKLLDHIRFDPNQDRLWFVGDLVNRGPESASVLRYVKGLGSAAVTVLGNHDLHVLAVAAGVARPNRKDTFQDVLAAPDRDELLFWLRHQLLIHQERGFVLVHAGLLPQWTIDKAMELGQEVERVLHSDDYQSWFPALYYHNARSQWTETLPETIRLGVTTNAMTRLRVCSLEGEMDLSYKGPPDDAPTGLLPWFRVPNRQSVKDTIIFGHWSALGVFIGENVLAIDGGCVWGRQLVAVRLEDREIFAIPCHG